MAFRNSLQNHVRTPLAAPAEPPRYVMLHGLETPSGGPVLALATGHPRRPVLTALVSFASLAASRAEGGRHERRP